VSRLWIAIAGLAGFLGVALGASARHATLAGDPEHLEIAGRYLLFHAPAILGLGLLAERRPSRVLTAAGAAFTIGLVLFAGGLAVNAFSGSTAVIAVVPFGGVALMIGWAALAVSAWKR
jgi:uncharacterized membrane protein YgdD (TMEM256/DUF423 family)